MLKKHKKLLLTVGSLTLGSLPFVAVACATPSTTTNTSKPSTPEQPTTPANPGTQTPSKAGSQADTLAVGPTYVVANTDLTDAQKAMPFSYYITSPAEFSDAILKPIKAKEANSKYVNDLMVTISADQYKQLIATKNADGSIDYKLPVSIGLKPTSVHKATPIESMYTFKSLPAATQAGIGPNLVASRSASFDNTKVASGLLTMSIDLQSSANSNGTFLGYLADSAKYTEIINNVSSQLALKDAIVVNAAVDFTKFRKTAPDTYVLDFWVVGQNGKVFSNGQTAIKQEVAFKVANEKNRIKNPAELTAESLEVLDLFEKPLVGLAGDTKLENTTIEDLLNNHAQRDRYLGFFSTNSGAKKLGYGIHFGGATDVSASRELVPGMSVARLWLARENSTVPGVETPSAPTAIYVLVPTSKVVDKAKLQQATLKYETVIANNETIASTLADATKAKPVLDSIMSQVKALDSSYSTLSLFTDTDTFTSITLNQQASSADGANNVYDVTFKLMTPFGSTFIKGSDSNVAILPDGRGVLSVKVQMKMPKGATTDEEANDTSATFKRSKLASPVVINVDLSTLKTPIPNLQGQPVDNFSFQTLPVYYADATHRQSLIDQIKTAIAGSHVDVVTAAMDFEHMRRVSNDAFVLDFWVIATDNKKFSAASGNENGPVRINAVVKVTNEVPANKFIASTFAGNYDASKLQNNFITFNDMSSPLNVNIKDYFSNAENRKTIGAKLAEKLGLTDAAIVTAQDPNVDIEASSQLIPQFNENPGVALVQFWLVANNNKDQFQNGQPNPIVVRALVYNNEPKATTASNASN